MYVIAVLCVVGIAIGQILFKASARSFEIAGTYYNKEGLLVLFSAFVLYGFTTLCWVWVLQRMDLGRVYPLMALAFVMVPVASYFMFDERFSLSYAFGILLIIAGIVLTARS